MKNEGLKMLSIYTIILHYIKEKYERDSKKIGVDKNSYCDRG